MLDALVRCWPVTLVYSTDEIRKEQPEFFGQDDEVQFRRHR